jgi:hypothetical protein
MQADRGQTTQQERQEHTGAHGANFTRWLGPPKRASLRRTSAVKLALFLRYARKTKGTTQKIQIRTPLTPELLRVSKCGFVAPSFELERADVVLNRL